MAKSTRLQTKLNFYYDNSKDNLGESSEYLAQITKIAGNRGLSHEERVKRIGDWVNHLNEHDTLNDSARGYLDGLLKINRNYIRETKDQKNEIKDIYETRLGLHNLRREIRSNLERNIKSNKEQLPAEIALPTLAAETPITPIQIKEYQSHHSNPGFLRKLAGSALVDIVAGVIISGASLVFGHYLGKESQQPIIKEKQEIIEVQQKIADDYEQREISYKASIRDKDGIINKKDDEISAQGMKLALADKLKEEARQQVIETTTKGLTSKYEDVIEGVKKQAQARVDELLKQRSDLERKLAIAGMPDEEVRQKVLKECRKENERQIANKDPNLTDFQNSVWGGVGLVKDPNLVVKQYLQAAQTNTNSVVPVADSNNVYAHVPDNNTPNVSVVPVVSSVADVNHSPVVVDANFIQEGAWPKDRQKYLQDAQTEPVITSNILWEDRMGIVGDAWLEPNNCSVCDEIYEERGFHEKQYLQDKFGQHPKRVGRERIKENWRRKNLLGFLGSLAEGTIATANDVGEFFVVRPVLATVGGIVGTGSRILGNENDSFCKGWRDGNKVAAYVMDGAGGESKLTFDNYLFKGQFKKAFKTPSCMEGFEEGNAKFRANVKLIEIIGVDTACFWWDSLFGHHGHHHAGFGGRRNGEGPGGNSIITSGGKSTGGVAGR